MTETPGWASQFGLVRKGNYYEGFVDNLSSVLEIHQRDTVSTWGTRRSTYACDKENTPCEKDTPCEKVIQHYSHITFLHYVLTEQITKTVLDIE